MVQSVSTEPPENQQPVSEAGAPFTIADFEVLVRAAGLTVDQDRMPQLLQAFESIIDNLAFLDEPSERNDESRGVGFDAGWVPNRRRG